MQKTPLFCVLILLLTRCSLLGATWWWPPTQATQIDPPYPNSSDLITINLSGQWPDSCIPTGSSISVKGNDIFFDVISHPVSICLTVITDWQQSQQLGPLAKGHYRVFARLIGDFFVSEIYLLVAEFDVTPDPIVLPFWVDAVEILPENPTPLTPITISMLGTWLDTCAPDRSSISIDGQNIYFTVNLPNQNACGDFPTSWKQTQILKPLPPGHYRLFGILNNPLILAPLIPELIAEFDISPKVISSVFRFIPDGSSLHVTGGFAGIDETVPVEGRFKLTLDFVSKSASFDLVKAKYGSGLFVPGGDLGMLFNMTNLIGEIDGPQQATFHGTTVPEGHEIFMRVQLSNTGAVEVIGAQPATPVCCDFFHFDLKAVAIPVAPCRVDYPFLAPLAAIGR